ncbi:MAG TPA: 3'-5' exonuclease [Streptosporangiaceae bacterium]|nr:3'-5' exonuclease [Streptosporangiaceae bacterium]
MLYGLLDSARKRTRIALTETHASGGPGGTFQARVEREVTAGEQARRLAQLEAVEHGLCFGRTDTEREQGTLYIGRIGLRDDEHEPRLIDWRAPAARPFYSATPKDPHGLVRRRHIYTRNRTVTAVDDEVFDLDAMTDEDKRNLSGEAMLIASINQARTGRMSDVVATIQAEQDRVIRAALQGVMVVQGGPGTGKTVAALHRAAYLLYTHRRTLERRGVLVIGPNPVFLRYISQVLPSLGETDVVLTSVAELYPGEKAAPDDDPAAAAIKGDPRMVNVIRQAVKNAQRVPDGDLTVTVDGVTFTVARDVVLRARDRARGMRKPHNVARKLFVTDLLGALARAEAKALDRPLDSEDIPYARARLWDEPPVRAALDGLWPLLTPQRLVAALLAEEGALRAAAPSLTTAERRALLRPQAPDRWTVADVPLLDEARLLLGADDSEEKRHRRAEERERRLEEKYAREVLQMTGLAGQGFVDARTLADWNRDPGQQLTTAERAWADPSWAYGHVIVDEAQELSPMAWRMVMRKIPTRSLTVVGDVAQRGSAAGARSWAQVLDPYVKGRWHQELLTVNYRTPAEIMAVAADVLAEVAPDEQAPESVRAEGVPPRAVQVPSVPSAVAGVVAGELAELGGAGRLAVIAPAALLPALAAELPAAVAGDHPDVLDSQVALLTVGQSKGLEFDRVVLADPAGIVAQSPAGGHDLYVAITRATRRLTVVYEGDLPRMLGRLMITRG